MTDVNPLTHSFVPIAFMVGMSVLTGVGVLLISWFFGGGSSSHAGETIYECGLDPMEPPGKRFPVKFYTVAILFILFDVEIALLYPLAVYFGGVADTAALRFFAWAELMVFMAILVGGYVYLYKAGAFDWARIMGRRPRIAAGSPIKRAS